MNNIDIKLFVFAFLDFGNRHIIYLAGTNDTDNCRWFNYEGCTDHSIESHCKAMLQGTFSS